MTLEEQIVACEQRIREMLEEARGILGAAGDENRDLTDEERRRHDEIMGSPGTEGEGEIARLEAQRARLVAMRSTETRLEEFGDDNRRQQLALAMAGGGGRSGGSAGRLVMGSQRPVSVPLHAQVHRPLRVFQSPEEAYAAGRWIMASVFNHGGSRQWCREHGIDIRGDQTIGTDSEGGYLVPAPLERAVIQIITQYGVIRRFARNYPMSANTLDIGKRSSGLTAAPAAELADLLASNETSKVWTQVALVARKWATYTQVSTELAEDAIIDIAEDLAMEIGVAFAYAEDNAGFNGDGTGTYNSITGVDNALLAGSIVTPTAGGGIDTFAELTFAHFESMIGNLPHVPGLMPRWYITKSGYAGSMLRLLDAAGGNTIRTLEEGARMQNDDFVFLGYPGSFLQVGMESSAAAASGKGAAYFGDLRMGISFGVRRGVTVGLSDQRHFELDAIAVKGTERFDIQVHETGTASVGGVICRLDFPAS